MDLHTKQLQSMNIVGTTRSLRMTKIPFGFRSNLFMHGFVFPESRFIFTGKLLKLGNHENINNVTSLTVRGGSSGGAAGLQPSLKNVGQKIPPNGQTRLKFGFSYENFTTQSFSVHPTPFRINVF